MTPNLELLADGHVSLSASGDTCALLSDEQTAVCDAEEDVDMDMRAPYIPMSGEDDLIFGIGPPVPLMDEIENTT